MSVASLQDVGRDLAGASVFVTGGTGFLGRNLVRELRAAGAKVQGLAWTRQCEQALEADGAKSVRGDLHDEASLAVAFERQDYVVHAAGHMRVWGDLSMFRAVNVQGTKNVISACRRARVRRLLHVSAAAVVMRERPALGVDEQAPRQYPHYSAYIRTKSEAEDLVVSANEGDLETVIIRPPGIWGAGDPYFLPKIAQAVVAGKFRWIDGGEYPFSSCHVRNVCEGILLGLTRGRAGEAYFVTDQAKVTFRELLTELLSQIGVRPPTASITFDHAWRTAQAVEAIWAICRLKSEPPLTRSLLKLTGQGFSVNDDKARAELGYRSRMGWRAGMTELAQPIRQHVF